MDSLKIKTAKNLGIVYGANLITTIFGVAALVILARLLTPGGFWIDCFKRDYNCGNHKEPIYVCIPFSNLFEKLRALAR